MKSKHCFVFGLLVFVLLSTAPQLCTQELEAHRIAGLRRLPELAIVLRPTGKELLTMKEIHDIAFVFIKAKIPVLKFSDTKNASAWLEIQYITAADGGLIRLALHRWIVITGTGEEAFRPIWDNLLLITGQFTRQHFQETLERLLTSFAADYYRANQ